MAESLPERLHTSSGERRADLQGHGCVPVLGPVRASMVTPEVVDEIAPFPSPPLPGLLPETELSALPQASLMPLAVIGRLDRPL